MSLCSSTTGGDVHYVGSKPSSECLFLNISERQFCKTLDEYASNTTVTGNSESGGNSVTMMFLPGVHNLTTNFSVKEKLNFTLVGQSSKINQTHIHLLHGSISVQSVAQVTLYKLSINGFSNYTVSLKGVIDVKFEDVVITGSAFIIQCLGCNSVTILDIHCIGSPLVIAWPEYDLFSDTKAYKNVVIRDAVFHLSPKGNGLSCCNVQSSLIVNISISNLPSNSTIKQPERSLITINYCLFFPWGLFGELEVCDLLTTNIHYLRINNSTFKRTNGTGICVNAPLGAYVVVKNSTIIDHLKGGAIFSYENKGISVTLFDNNISNNVNTLQGLSMASALSVYTAVKVENTHPHNIPRLRIENTHFVGNKHLVSRPISTVAITSHIKASIHDCNFTDNYGSAITAYTTTVDHVLVIFSGTILFRNNTSHRGGALHLFQSRIGLEKHVQIVFDSNFAEDVGGAIYVHSTQWQSSYYDIEAGNYGDCFYLIMDCHGNVYGHHFAVKFKNNSAKNGGEHIFGASMQSHCNICPLSGLSTSVVYHQFTFSQPSILTFSPISSHPSRICVCNETFEYKTPRYFCTYASQIFLSRSVHPGEEFNLEVVLVGAEFGTGTGSVYAQFLPRSGSELYPPHQYSQRVEYFKKCTHLSYTVYSSNSKEILVLTSTDETVLDYGDQNKIEKVCERYDRDLLMHIAPPSLLTTSVYINLTLLPCPDGFHLTGRHPGCDCVPALITNDIFCNFTHGIGYVYRNGTVWVDTLEDNFILIQRRCPFDYCLSYLTGVELRDPDTQCAMNHAGTLCGGCKNGLSLALGTNMCFSCKENKHLALIVFFILAGLLLVVFIKVLNMTVSQGTINGLVFYANVVWAYQNVFFPNVTTNGWFSVMKTFIAWLNLDFGIQTCFVQGLTGYAKTWLQFVFPLYIWSIAGAMTISAHYSRMMTILFGNNCVQVLATLFLLSYVKLFRTIITVIVPAVLEIYPQSTEQRSGLSIVWAFDGNLSYGGNPHGFLLVAALFTLIVLWLPYTVILLVFRLIMKRSSHKCFKWSIRIVPLIEPYFGPLKIAHYYWVGLLLLVRGVLLIILTLTYTTTPSASVLSLVITMALLFVLLSYTGSVYRNKLLSLLECSFFVNLHVLAASVLFIDVELSDFSKEVAVTTSMTIAFIQFLGISFYHLYQIFSKVIKTKVCMYFQWKKRDIVEEVVTDDYQLMRDESVNVLVTHDLRLQYLEDYAENADL